MSFCWVAGREGDAHGRAIWQPKPYAGEPLRYLVERPAPMASAELRALVDDIGARLRRVFLDGQS